MFCASRVGSIAAMTWALAFVLPFPAAAGPVAIPGGEIDTALSSAGDVYVSRPMTAQAGSACKAAKAYVDLIQAGRYDTVADLFAKDAVLMEPVRRAPRVGRAEIADFFHNTIARSKPTIVAVAYVGEGRDCFAELVVEMPVDGEARFVLTSVDHFTTDEGGAIARMVAFSRPLGPGAGAPRMD